MLTLKKINKKEAKIYNKFYDNFVLYFPKQDKSSKEHAHKFESGFKAYKELIDIKNINSGKKIRKSFFYFIENNSESGIKNFTKLIQFLKSKELLSKLFLKKLLCKPMLDSNDQFNKADFLKYIHNYCVKEISKYEKLDDFKEVFELLCNNVSGFKKYDLIIETIGKNKNLVRNKLTNKLTNKISDIFKHRIESLIKNKGKKENLRDEFKFFTYIEEIYDLITKMPQINPRSIEQLFTISSNCFEEMSCAIFSLQENPILTKDNIDFIIQHPKTAGNIAIIIVALSKFELFNEHKNKEIIKNNAQHISFDLAMIFAEIAKCKSNETNKAIMQTIFDHVFKNLNTCKEFTKEICRTILYLQEENFLTLGHIQSWLNNKYYKNSFWAIRNLVENDILHKSNYKRLMLLKKYKGITKEKPDRDKNNQMHSLGKSKKITNEEITKGADYLYNLVLLLANSEKATKVISYLAETKILTQKTFDKLINFHKENKLQSFCQIIIKLYEFNMGQGAINLCKHKQIMKLITVNNYDNLAKFVDVPNKICDILERLNSVDFLNQYILDFLDEDKNRNNIDFILFRLNNSNVLKKLKKFGLVKELEELKSKITMLKIQKKVREKDINKFKNKNKNRNIENEEIILENEQKEKKLKASLDKTCENIENSLKKEKKIREKIQKQIAKIINLPRIEISTTQLTKPKKQPIKKIENKKTTWKDTMKRGLEFIKRVLSIFIPKKQKQYAKTYVCKKPKMEKFKGIKSVELEIKKEDPNKKRKGIKDLRRKMYFFEKGNQSNIHDGKPIIKEKSLSLRKNNQL